MKKYNYLIPDYIGLQLEKNIYAGNIYGSVLFVDIGGFTSLTEALLKKNGSEELSEILNYVFSKMINIVYENNGFISTFAGDAFTAIFNKNKTDVVKTACKIQKIFENQTGIIKKYNLYVKMGISYGKISWGILGKKNKRIYYFKGSAINNASFCEGMAGKNEIICDTNYANKENLQYKIIDKKYFLLKCQNFNIEKKRNNSEIIIKNEILKEFYQENVLNPQNIGEFRNVESLFIQYKDFTSNNEFKKFINDIIELSHIYKGYFNLMDFGDKGNLLFIIFGAPTSYEDDIRRSVKFALQIRNLYPNKTRIGITSGNVFAGIIGNEKRATYTVLGDNVNMAARFMTRAKWNEIFICENTGYKIQGDFEIDYMGSLKFKGKTHHIPVYALIKKSVKTHEYFYENEFIGRKNEIRKISEIISKLDNKNNSLIHIYGPPGIGKTRLIIESIKNVKYPVYFMKCDSILKKSLNVFQSLLEDYFNISENFNKKQNNDNFDKEFNNIIKKLSNNKYTNILNEFRRSEFVYKGILKINMHNTFYEDLDPKGKYDNTVNAIILFFKILLNISPSIFIIEDLQWIDNDSYKIFNELITQLSDMPFSFIFSSRNNEINFNNIYRSSKSIHLNKFDLESTKQMISNQMGYRTDKSLTDFIIGKTENNPFYIEQFCRYLYEKNYVRLKKGILYLTVKKTDVPEGIYAILIARLDNLTNELKKAIQVAAVLGNEFDIGILSSIIKNKNVNFLLENGINEDIWNAISDMKYIFKHALLKDAAYNMQLKKQLRRLHLIVGDLMKKKYKNKKKYYKDIAYHYERGKNNKEARIFYEKAGDYAIKNYAISEAVELYQNVVLLSRDKLFKLQIHLKLINAYEIMAEWKKAVIILRRLLKIAKKEKYYHEELRILRSLGYFLDRIGKRKEAVKILRNTIKKFSPENEYAIEIMGCYNNLGNAYSHLGEYKNALKQLTNALNIQLYTSDKRLPQLHAFIYNSIGMVYMNQREFEKALEYFKVSYKIAKKSRIKRNYSATNIANIYFYNQKYKIAIKYYKKQIKIAEELQDNFLLRVVNNNLGSIYTILEEFSKAIEYYNNAYEIGKKINDQNGIRVILTNIGSLYLYMGKYGKSIFYFEKALKIAIKMNDELSTCKVLGQFCAFYYETKQHELLKTTFNKGLKIANKKDWKELVKLFLFYKAYYYYMNKNIKYTKKIFIRIDQLQDVKVDEEIVVRIDILRLKVFNMLDIKELKKIAKQHKNPYCLLMINMELYKISKNKNIRKKIIQIAKRLYQKTNSVRYKKILDEYEKL